MIILLWMSFKKCFLIEHKQYATSVMMLLCLDEISIWSVSFDKIKNIDLMNFYMLYLNEFEISFNDYLFVGAKCKYCNSNIINNSTNNIMTFIVQQTKHRSPMKIIRGYHIAKIWDITWRKTKLKSKIHLGH